MKAIRIFGVIIMSVSFLMAVVSLFQGRGIIVFLSLLSGVVLGFVIYVSGFVKTWLE